MALAAGHCDVMALAVFIALLNELLAGLPAQSDHITIGFSASHSTHDVISEIPEVTALQRLGHKISNHLLGGTPINADFLHVHSMCDKEVLDVDIPHALAT
jgi:hypothetical protein